MAFICEWVESDVDPDRNVELNISFDIGLRSIEVKSKLLGIGGGMHSIWAPF